MHSVYPLPCTHRFGGRPVFMRPLFWYTLHSGVERMKRQIDHGVAAGLDSPPPTPAKRRPSVQKEERGLSDPVPVVSTPVGTIVLAFGGGFDGAFDAQVVPDRQHTDGVANGVGRDSLVDL